jgi:transcriptional regulator with XRE-family HTH domain
MTLGERIKQVRTEKNMTQTELAKKIGVSKQAVYKYESGIVTNIPFERLEQIANALNVSIAQIVGTEIYSQEALDEILQMVVTSLTGVDEKYKLRFFYALSRLDGNGWKVIERVAQALYDEQMEEDAKKETEQHKTAERSVPNVHKEDQCKK